MKLKQTHLQGVNLNRSTNKVFNHELCKLTSDLIITRSERWARDIRDDLECYLKGWEK